MLHSTLLSFQLSHLPCYLLRCCYSSSFSSSSLKTTLMSWQGVACLPWPLACCTVFTGFLLLKQAGLLWGSIKELQYIVYLMSQGQGSDSWPPAHHEQNSVQLLSVHDCCSSHFTAHQCDQMLLIWWTKPGVHHAQPYLNADIETLCVCL